MTTISADVIRLNDTQENLLNNLRAGQWGYATDTKVIIVRDNIPSVSGYTSASTAESSFTFTSAITFDDNMFVLGNTGIGTTSPRVRLDISAGDNGLGSSPIAGSVLALENSNNCFITLLGGDGNNEYEAIYFHNSLTYIRYTDYDGLFEIRGGTTEISTNELSANSLYNIHLSAGIDINVSAGGNFDLLSLGNFDIKAEYVYMKSNTNMDFITDGTFSLSAISGDYYLYSSGVGTYSSISASQDGRIYLDTIDSGTANGYIDLSPSAINIYCESGDILVDGTNINLTPGTNLQINGVNGYTGTFDLTASSTVTVSKGIITGVAP